MRKRRIYADYRCPFCYARLRVVRAGTLVMCASWKCDYWRTVNPTAPEADHANP